MRDFAAAYLSSFIFWIEIPLGAMGIYFMGNLTGGRWAQSLSKDLIGAASTFWLFLLLSLPLFFVFDILGPWHDVTALHGLKETYYSQRFFLVRSLVYIFIWFCLSKTLGRPKAKMPGASSRHLIILAITTTFASIDWMMSLEPHWYSTVYGLIFFVSTGVSGFALSVLGYLKRKTDEPGIKIDIGNFFLATIIVWTYLAFVQFLIIWSGNISVEMTWYVHRAFKPWNDLAVFLTLAQFAVPFILLLFRNLKIIPGILKGVAYVSLCSQAVYVFWLVLPSIRPKGTGFLPMDLAIFILMGGLWYIVYSRKSRVIRG